MEIKKQTVRAEHRQQHIKTGKTTCDGIVRAPDTHLTRELNVIDASCQQMFTVSSLDIKNLSRMKLLQETSMSSGSREEHIRESNSQLDPTTAQHQEEQHRNASRSQLERASLSISNPSASAVPSETRPPSDTRSFPLSGFWSTFSVC